MDLNRGYSSMMFGVSLVSILSCMPACLSFYMFVEIRKKPYYQVIFFLNLSVLCSSVGSLMGEPHDKTFACWFMGIVTNTFTLASICWTVVVSSMLYYIVVNGEHIKLNYRHHCFCWTVPLFLTLIPITRMDYGAPGGEGWCWVVPRENTPLTNDEIYFWYWFNFYLLLWSGYFSIIYLNTQTYRNLSNVKMENSKQSVYKILKKLRYYPWVIAISWLFTTVSDNFADSPLYQDDFEGNEVYFFMALFLPCCQGILTGIIFVVTCDEIRYAWYVYFTTKDLQLASSKLFDKRTSFSTSLTKGEEIARISRIFSESKKDIDRHESSGHSKAKVFIEEYSDDDDEGDKNDDEMGKTCTTSSNNTTSSYS